MYLKTEKMLIFTCNHSHFILFFQNYILAKVENLKPEMDKLVKELKRETAIAIRKLGWDEKHARIMFNRSVINP